MHVGSPPQVVTEATINCNLYGGINYLMNLEFNLYSRVPISWLTARITHTLSSHFSLGPAQFNSLLLYIHV